MHPTTTLLLAGDRAAGLLREAERERLARAVRPRVDEATGRPTMRSATGRGILRTMTRAVAALGRGRGRATYGRRRRGVEDLAW